jgi:molybdenum cofactor cytidylyltransferase
VLRVDADRLTRINECEGVAFATLPSYQIVEPGQTVATVKVIPYALPAAALDQVERARGAAPVILVRELKPRSVGLIYTGLPAAEQKLVKSFGEPLRKRVGAYGSHITRVDSVHLTGGEDEAALAKTLRSQVNQGVDLIVLANETSTMDPNDSAPRAIRQAGGRVICVGAPVDPGNLLLLAYLDGVPVLGVPGCVRSPKINIVDWVLPALLAGETLSRSDITRMGYGGLLEAAPGGRGSNQ